MSEEYNKNFEELKGATPTDNYEQYDTSNDTKTAFDIAIGIFAFVFIVCLLGDKLSPVLFFRELTCAALLTFSVMCICFIISLIKNRRFIKRSVFFISWLISLVIAIPHIMILSGYGTEEIGDFFEKDSYTATYYVEMSRYPEDGSSSRKIYTLPAEIERRLDWIGDTDNGYPIEQLNYHINYLYFPNGGYLYFNPERDYEFSIIIPHQETEVEDYHGDTYYITLTDKRANHEVSK